MPIFHSEVVVQAPLHDVWRFHADPRSLPKIMRGIHIEHIDEPIAAGSRIDMTLRLGPLRIPWTVVVVERQPQQFFRDEQPAGAGPWARWSHTHSFESLGPRTTLVRDRIEYAAPFGILGRIGAAFFGNAAMQLQFVGRRRATRALLEH
jgi:ligand-binding SRPBCC domain-containing protein